MGLIHRKSVLLFSYEAYSHPNQEKNMHRAEINPAFFSLSSRFDVLLTELPSTEAKIKLSFAYKIFRNSKEFD